MNNNNNNNNNRDDISSIAWLLSFPNSGTTYTLKFLQSITNNTTTATNYGGTEQVGYYPSQPILPTIDYGGPYLRYPDRRISSNPIVTKSHCNPNKIRITLDDFIISCRSGNYALMNGTILSTVYKIRPYNNNDNNNNNNNERDTDIKTITNLDDITSTNNTTPINDGIPLAKIIHLIRNPFDNIVARLHYQRKHWMNQINRLQHQLNDITDNTNNVSFTTNYDDDQSIKEEDVTTVLGNTTRKPGQQQQEEELRTILQEKIRYINKKLELFNDTQIGLNKWCNWLDRKSLHNLQHTLQDLRPPTLRKPNTSTTNSNNETAATISSTNTTIPTWYQRWEHFRLYSNNGRMPPCICEFYRYLQWHNNIVRMTIYNNTQSSSSSSKSSSSSGATKSDWLSSVPLLHLYYENYTMPNVTNTTTNLKLTQLLSTGGKQLLQFLNYDIEQTEEEGDDINDNDLPGSVPIFVYEGKQYSQSHYTLHDRIVLGQIAKSYLLPQTWELVQHYFPSDELKE
jgi:hypothetical protein